MLRILIAIALTALLLPAQNVEHSRVDQSEATMRLLELLTAGEDSDEFWTAAKQLAEKRSPSEALASYIKVRPPGVNLEQMNGEVGYAMRRLGDFIILNPMDFPKGLPNIGEFKNKRQLGPLFDVFLPHHGSAKELADRLEIFNPLIDESWLEAAIQCGAYDFHHLILARRGRIGQMLTAYQVSGDEIGIIRLGEAIGRNAEFTRSIAPAEFSSRTLCLFLAGAFSVRGAEPTEKMILVEVALGWKQSHPEILKALADLHGDRSTIRLFEVRDLWFREKQESALKLLFSSRTQGDPWALASSVNSFLIRKSPSDQEMVSLARVIPTDILISCIRQLQDGDTLDDDQARLSRLMMPIFHSRPDRTKEQWISFSMDKAKKIALRWWKEDRLEDAFLLLQEAFFNLTPDEHTKEMQSFAVLAHVLGKEASVMKELEKRAAHPSYPDLILHKAALLTVAGKQREALKLARSRPPGDLYYQLLLECEEWDSLREAAFSQKPRFERKYKMLCHAAFLNKDAASARDYFNGLPESTKNESALLLLLSGNDELFRKYAGKLIGERFPYSIPPLPISMHAFDVWEAAILNDLDSKKPPRYETVYSYTKNAGMTRDKARTTGILERLFEDGKLNANISGTASNRSQDRLTWQQRIRVAACLIELGAVDEGCRALEEMQKEGAGSIEGVRDEFWRAFLPTRFTHNGFAEYLKIAELELPTSTNFDRHVFLAKTLAENPPTGAVRRMIAMLAKHRAKISFDHASLLLQNLSVALCGEPGAQEIQGEAEQLLAFYQPSRDQVAFFRRWARPALSEDRFYSRTEIEEKPGEQHDPRSDTFRVIDGMERIRSLLENRKNEEAASLFRQMAIRILLDELPKESITVRKTINRRNLGSAEKLNRVMIPVAAARCWNLHAPFLRDYTLRLWRSGDNGDRRELALSLAYFGDCREARVAAFESLYGYGQNDLGNLRLLPAMDGLTLASEGRVDEALGRLDVCLDLSPLDPTPGMAILEVFKKRGDAQAVQRVSARIRDYWNQKLAEYPISPHVREASHYWLGELERSL